MEEIEAFTKSAHVPFCERRRRVLGSGSELAEVDGPELNGAVAGAREHDPPIGSGDRES